MKRRSVLPSGLSLAILALLSHGCFAFHYAYDDLSEGVDKGWVFFDVGAGKITVHDPETERDYTCEDDCTIAKVPGWHEFRCRGRVQERRLSVRIEKNMVTVVKVTVGFGQVDGTVYVTEGMSHEILPPQPKDEMRIDDPGYDVWAEGQRPY